MSIWPIGLLHCGGEGGAGGGGGWGGLTNERPQTGHVITGPMKSLEKIALEGDKQVNTPASRLLDQLGRVGENVVLTSACLSRAT